MNTEPKYVEPGKYRFTEKRLNHLVNKVNKEEFVNAYTTGWMLKEIEEYFNIKTDDIYILMMHWHIPYRMPNVNQRALHTRVNYGREKPRKFDNIDDTPIPEEVHTTPMVNPTGQITINLTDFIDTKAFTPKYEELAK